MVGGTRTDFSAMVGSWDTASAAMNVSQAATTHLSLQNPSPKRMNSSSGAVDSRPAPGAGTPVKKPLAYGFGSSSSSRELNLANRSATQTAKSRQKAQP